MTMSERQQDLLGAPRWQQAGRVIDWHMETLGAADGCSPEEIDRIEERLGQPLPTALREWFELLGHRLQAVRDIPATPQDIQLRDGLVEVWRAAAGEWSLAAPSGEDPTLHLGGNEAPLSTWLVAMLMSETLVGACRGELQGPLGLLYFSIMGGEVDHAAPDVLATVREDYTPFALPLPTPEESWYFDGGSVIRLGASGRLEWAIATHQAYHRIDALLGLAAGVTQVLARVTTPTPEEIQLILETEEEGRVHFFGGQEVLDAVWELGDIEHMMQRTVEPTSIEVLLVADAGHEALCDLLVEKLAPIWGERLVIAWRSGTEGEFTVVHPDGVTDVVEH
ncbi:SMI1/KNR4 family protein [Arachnia propionica]|uniref:SMI1/KNR4 family protein n=1 Tax=Arachnia propionica TaxID=1750 RepID=A0A3P1T9D7_9ACTN|nr:SMI1/KNR4 family protein [Arachnia propionica]RRD06062.1 SMI1/KNR4 family protein [Arachnia propionica]